MGRATATEHPASARPSARPSVAGTPAGTAPATPADPFVGPEPETVAEGPARGPVVWKRTWVQDRPAQYGVVGEGMPVVFAHGWALGQHSYKAVLHRLAEQGCQVFAPALPGFGGTPGLPRQDFHLAGYAAWLEEFIRAVGVQEKVVLVGHSFGGGVGIRLAYDHPDVVRSLVLVNSIGGSSWKRGKVLTSIAERPLWDWGLHFPSDVWPIRQATRVLPVILEDCAPQPGAQPELGREGGQHGPPGGPPTRAGGAEAAPLPGHGDLGQPGRHHPARSPSRRCAPRSGRAGTVVEGSHSWLLADPGRFVEVITNDLQVALRAREMEARSKPAEEGTGALRRLFGRSRRKPPRELDELDGSGPG